MRDKSVWFLFLIFLVLGFFLGSYDEVWQQGAKKVANNNDYSMTSVENDIYLEVIWDASSSMWGKEYGVEKIIRSKEVLKTFTEQLPEDFNIGLRIFGARKTGDLKDSFLAVPITDENKGSILNFITNVKPLGKSPIGYSLREAKKDLENKKGKKFILLVSDGLDNGNIPPQKVVKELKEKNITLHIIHIGNLDDEKVKTNLQKLAELTGGKYFTYNEHNEVVRTLLQY